MPELIPRGHDSSTGYDYTSYSTRYISKLTSNKNKKYDDWCLKTKWSHTLWIKSLLKPWLQCETKDILNCSNRILTCKLYYINICYKVLIGLKTIGILSIPGSSRQTNTIITINKHEIYQQTNTKEVISVDISNNYIWEYLVVGGVAINFPLFHDNSTFKFKDSLRPQIK